MKVFLFINLVMFLMASSVFADWYAVTRLGFLQATTTGNLAKKNYSGGAYQGEAGFSSSVVFTAFQFSHALTSGEGEAGDIMALGLNFGVKLDELYLLLGYDYRFQYSADIVAAFQGNSVRGGVGYNFSPSFNMKIEYTIGTFTNFAGTKITDKEGINTYALWFGFPFGSF